MFSLLFTFLLASSTLNANVVFSRRRLVSYTASMSEYPDYSGLYTVNGDVVIKEESEGSTSVTVTYDLSGLEESTSGGIHIHIGTSCAAADFVGGHYYDDSLSTDPWTVEWTSDSSGVASGVVTVETGILIDDNYGHALVVHDSDGTRSACGLLGTTEYSTDLGSYPDYDGNYTIDGTVAVSETIDGYILINFELFGLEEDTSGGIHIHEGTTCLVADWVSGHYYSVDSDPWDITWTSDSFGAASGYAIVNSGYNAVSDNYGHALVVHESSGTRAACGLIGDLTEYMVMNLGPYPDYSGSYESIAGYVVVTENVSDLSVTYDLTGLEIDSEGGIHIHEGTTCVAGDLVGGHYYDMDEDPWTTDWTSDSQGNAVGSFTITTNLEIEENYGHALVIHESDGTRAACGLIGAIEITSVLSSYPDYSGTLIVSGSTAVAETLDGSLLLNYVLEGLESDISGGIHIHSGTTCLVADMVSGHHYDTDALSSDPWSTTYTSDEDGVSYGSFTIDTGYDTITENLGHAVVVHESGGDRAACGLLGEGNEWLSTMDAYPDYSGDYKITGYVVVAEEEQDSDNLRVSYSLTGLEISTSGGLHIHAGTTCSSANLVGGHYYDSDSLSSDPWSTEWESDEDGSAFGDFTIESYYGLDENYGHAVVVHLSSDEGSTRAACGLIGSTEYWATFDKYPDYSGSNSISGTFAVSLDINDEVLVNYDLEGLESDTSGGIHIHAGTTCAVADMVQGHFYNSSWSSDPWSTTWSSDDDGNANGYFTIDYGYNTIADNLGHAAVVHESDGTRAACGAIGDGQEYLATLSSYPDYPYDVSGYVVVAAEYDGATTMRISCGLSGLEASTTGGIHIHVGTTCDNKDDIGENYYDSTYTDGTDPWIEMWESDSSGDSTTSFVIDTGYSLEDNHAHALVIEDSSGIPISCGIVVSNMSVTSSGFSVNSLALILIIVCCVLFVALVFLGRYLWKPRSGGWGHKWTVIEEPKP